MARQKNKPRKRWQGKCDGCGRLEKLEERPVTAEFLSPCPACGSETGTYVRESPRTPVPAAVSAKLAP